MILISFSLVLDPDCPHRPFTAVAVVFPHLSVLPFLQML